MIVTPYLGLAWVLWTPEFAAAVVADLAENDLTCKFVLNQLEFDLCPLLKAHADAFEISIEEETLPTHTKYVYTVGFGSSLSRDGTLPAKLQCPEGTRICLTVVNTRPDHPSEPSRILQVVPIASNLGLNPTSMLGKKDKDTDLHAPLQVTLHGGSYMDQSQKATFLFHCDQGAEPSTPSFLWKFNGTHAFSWRTRHACHKPLTAPQPQDPDPDSDPPQDPPGDPESEHDNTTPMGNSHSILTLLWLAIPLFFMSRLLYFWLRRGRNHNRIPFPMSLSALKWKQTGSALFPLSTRLFTWQGSRKSGNDMAGSNTAMHDLNYFEDGQEGEEVPLTPNPRGTFGDGKQGLGHYGSF